mgnify:CR=1 FL=1
MELKLNDKYLVLNNPTRYFIITGGRGSSKSYSINTLLTLLTFEAGHKILFTRYTLRAASISIIPEFIEKLEVQNIEHNFHITKDEIINKQTGSKILFRGIKTSSGDQTANLKSIQGVTTFVLDEAEELTDESIFDKIDLSVRQKDKDNRVILILNPTTKENFIYKRWFEDRGVKAGSNLMKGDTTYVHTTYLDNIENLSKSYIEQIEQMKVRRPNRYKHTIMGSWLDKAEGVIYNNWSIGEFKQVGKIVFGQDYGFSNDPSTLVKTSILTILNKKYAGKNLIVGDSAEPRLISEIKSSGCNIVAAIKGQGSITYGISLLQDYDLVIDSESIELIKELNNYCWLERKSQTPQDSFNHCLDALRYSVSYQLQNPNSGEYFLY